MKLYDLTKQYAKLSDMDQDDQAVKDTMEGLDGEIEAKADGIAHVMNQIDSDVSSLDVEISRLQNRKKALSNRKDSLKDYLRANMEAQGKKKIQSSLFTISCVAGRDMAVIDDEKKIPSDYIKEKVVKSIDKASILAALKSGDLAISGAHLEKTKSSIRIK